MLVRSRSLIRALALAGALLAAVAAPAPAQMAVAQKVLADFATDGVIDPCKHTSDELRVVLKNIPPEFEQYAPDYPAAVKAALEARARGECAGKKPQAPVATATPAPVATPRPTPVPTAIPTKTVVPEPPEPEKIEISATATATPSGAGSDGALERVATARAANSAPAPVLLLAILSALLALGALFLLAMRRGDWEHGRMAPVAHAWREASFRAGGLWEDFRDWLRVGR